MIMFACSILAAVLTIIGIRYGADWLHDRRSHRMIRDTRHLAEFNKMERTTPERAESEQDDGNKVSEKRQQQRKRIRTGGRRRLGVFRKERQGVRLGYYLYPRSERSRDTRM